MQREDQKLNMPGGFKSNRADASNNNARLSGAVSSAQDASNATPMRAANANPHGSSFEVAGPSVGGAPSPFNSDRLEQAKEHLADSLNGLNHAPAPDHSISNVSSSGTGHARRSSLTDTVLSGASSAATGAAAAGASVIAAAKKLIHHDDDEHAVLQDVYDTHNTVSASGIDSPSKLNAGDRAPLKVAIHAQKPSDKATFGNLDSPGAMNRPGPLSERALAGTVPVTEASKTIADPFGPVKVTNWNDGTHEREPETSTPKAEDFDSWFESPRWQNEPLSDYAEKSFTAPGAVPSAPVTHNSSAAAPAGVARAHSGLRNEVHDDIPLVSASTHAPHHNARASATLAALGAAATTAAVAGHHGDSSTAQPIPYNTAAAHLPIAQLHSTTATQRIPIAQPPTQNQEFRQPIKQIPIAQPPREISHPIQTSTNLYQYQEPEQHNIAGAATVAGAAAAAVPLAMHSNAAPTASAAQPKASVIGKVKNVLHRNSASGSTAGQYEIANDTTAQVAGTEASVLLAQQEYAAKYSSQPNANIAVGSTAPMNTAAPINTSSFAAPAMAAAGTAAAGAAAAHHHHHHHQPAEATIPIIHNTATIATSSAAPVMILNKRDEVPLSQYDSYHHSSLPFHHNAPVNQPTAAPVHTTPSTAGRMAAPVAVATAGTAAGVAALLHKEDTAAPRHHLDSEVVDNTLPAGPSEHQAYLANNTAQMNAAPANIRTTPTTTTVPATAPAVHHHHSSAVPVTVASAAVPAAYAVNADIKQQVFSPVDNSVHRPTAPVPAPTFDTRYMNAAPVGAAPIMQKTTTTTTTVQDQTRQPLTEKISAPMVGAAAAATGAATAGVASLAQQQQQHSMSKTSTTTTTPVSAKPLEHVEYTLRPSDVHPITSSSISATGQQRDASAPYTASTTTTNPALNAPRIAIPATVPGSLAPTVNVSKTTTTTTTAPLQQHQQQQRTMATNVPIQQQQQYTPTTNVPIQQQQYTPTTNVPIQQQQYTPTTNVPIQQQRYTTTTNVPIQQQQYTPTTNVPIQQQQYTTTTGVPTQQQQQQYTTTTVRTPAAAAAPIAAAATVGAAAVGVNNSYRQSTTTTSTTNTGYNNQTMTSAAAPPTATVTSQKGGSATEIASADKIAAAIPESYHGPIPQLHAGEELVWLKTITTTEVYGDGTPADRNTDGYNTAVQSNTEGFKNINLNSNANINKFNNDNNIINTNNNDGYINQQQLQQQQLQPQQQQGGRRGSFLDRLLGRQPGVDKGKGRL